MRTIVATTTKLALLGAFFVFTGIGLSDPSYAGGEHHDKGCHYSRHKLFCPGSRLEPSGSTDLFPDRCNGELGFWYPVTFANGETLCIARSIADFYHNSDLVQTCTVSHKDEDSEVWISSTSDGACPPKHHRR